MTFPAFPSLLTGLNPGRHGILGPEAVDLARYRAGEGGAKLAVGSGAIAGRTVLDLAGRAGRRVLAYGVPMTYPAWAINGVLVAAQVARLLDRLGGDWLVVLASDHGGGPAPTFELHMNAWLRGLGLLVPTRSRNAQLKRAVVQTLRRLVPRRGLGMAIKGLLL